MSPRIPVRSPSTSHPISCPPTFKRKQKPVEFSLPWLPGLGPAWSVIARSHCMEESWLFLSPKQSDGHSSHLSLSKLGFCWAWAHAGSVMRDSSGLIGPSSYRLLGQVTGVRLGMVIQNASLGTDIILLTPSSFLLRCTSLNSWIFINELSNWRNKQILTKWDPWWSVIKHAFNQKIGTADLAS